MNAHLPSLRDGLKKDKASLRAAHTGSTLSVFGENLRQLTAMRGTQTSVANELDLSRVQFQRFLRGESFPKPNLLKRICDYFHVDARVLTEPLSDRLVESMMLDRTSESGNALFREWNVALSYAAQNQDFFNQHAALEPGLYAAWYWSLVKANTVTRLRIQISRQHGVNLLRGYHIRGRRGPSVSAAHRQFRGICLATRQGHSMLIFPSLQSDVFSTWYVSPNYLPGFSSDVHVGFSAICRNELPGLPRMSRLVIERLRTDGAHLLTEARTKSYFTIEKVPEGIRSLLSAPIG